MLKSYKTGECSGDIHMRSFYLTLCWGMIFTIRGGLHGGGADTLKRNFYIFSLN